LFIVVQPETDEGVGGDRTDEGVEVGEEGVQAKTSTREASAAEMTGEDLEAYANVSAEALATDVAAATEVWMLGGGLILGWVIFMEFKMLY
jgi:hypothetical protein